MVLNRVTVFLFTLQAIILVISAASLQSSSNDNDSVPLFKYPVYRTDGSIDWFPRIVGGELANLGEFRGKLSLQYTNGNHFCGATLITPTRAITAAHCIVQNGVHLQPKNVQLMGDDLGIGKPASSTRQIIKVKKIATHPNYNAYTLQNDIAVLILDKKIKETPTFQPITRANISPVNNKLCQVAGWGVTFEGSLQGPYPRLLKVNVNVLDLKICNSSNSYDGLLTSNMICAGSMAGGKDSCQGDSGGGLICDNNVLTGIVSFGYGCAQPNYPGIYTDISKYNAWIDSVSGVDKLFIPITLISFCMLSIFLS